MPVTTTGKGNLIPASVVPQAVHRIGNFNELYLFYYFTNPENPINANERSPAVINEIGNPFIPFG